ncbi:Anthranilate phosphoribosyltransferase [Planctomycetes bacterium Pan216]|uniref:Anthranilate phosphoribosyltransferase n=1 Tax=Kolteria novifilia TaxID=2527975 RepID=A0A518B9G6_9BACT|nr:Anthranilate phosphoribosyltransferase [Planctomycetes bacterium Pan216]
MSVVELLPRLADGETLTREQTRSAVTEIMGGSVDAVIVASFLTALRVRGETVEELAGVASLMREEAEQIDHGIKGLLDTCGTGGDGSSTFNISTATAIVVSACDVPIAKHGNRAVSSSTGSADVLRVLGVNIEVEPKINVECLREIGLAFFFAPRWHPAMARVMPVRRTLRFRTIFNLAGPLTNPAGADYQLVGVGRREWSDKVARALAELGVEAATVVRGVDGLDEVTLADNTEAILIRGGELESRVWSPESFGLPQNPNRALRVASPEESAVVISSVLKGNKGPARNVVLANAAAALLTVGRTDDLREGVAFAEKAIDDGRALSQLEELVRRTNREQFSAP